MEDLEYLYFQNIASFLSPFLLSVTTHILHAYIKLDCEDLDWAL